MRSRSRNPPAGVGTCFRPAALCRAQRGACWHSWHAAGDGRPHRSGSCAAADAHLRCGWPPLLPCHPPKVSTPCASWHCRTSARWGTPTPGRRRAGAGKPQLVAGPGVSRQAWAEHRSGTRGSRPEHPCNSSPAQPSPTHRLPAATGWRLVWRQCLAGSTGGNAAGLPPCRQRLVLPWQRLVG